MATTRWMLAAVRLRLSSWTGGSVAALDAFGVTFADSSFLHLLLNTRHRTDLRTAAPAAQLRRVLELTGAGTVLDIWPTDDAVT
ncbi:anti-sigma factor antagonist [Streptomyces sp. NPDC059690]|uniref:anti-sigma factor antagonist n=1 Tax=Streptomyces sp. NPDC059690 TaxID=3346907 RepID=UPI00367D061A